MKKLSYFLFLSLVMIAPLIITSCDDNKPARDCKNTKYFEAGHKWGVFSNMFTVYLFDTASNEPKIIKYGKYGTFFG